MAFACPRKRKHPWINSWQKWNLKPEKPEWLLWLKILVWNEASWICKNKTQPTKQKVWLHSLIPCKSHHPLFYIPQKRWPTSKPFPMLTCTLIQPESSASKRLNKPRAFGSQHLNIQPKWWFSIGFPLPFEPERSHLPIPPMSCWFRFNFQWWNDLCLFVDVSAQVWRLHLWCVDANGVEVATIWRILQPWDICPAKNWATSYLATYDSIMVSNQKPLPGKEPQSHSPWIYGTLFIWHQNCTSWPSRPSWLKTQARDARH